MSSSIGGVGSQWKSTGPAMGRKSGRWGIGVCLIAMMSLQSSVQADGFPLPEPVGERDGVRQAGIYWVGPGDDCNFGSIQTAINATANLGSEWTQITVRVVDSQGFYDGTTYEIVPGQFEAVEDFIIVGGYETCGSSAQTGNRTALDAQGNGPVFTINHAVLEGAQKRRITLRNLDIGGGVSETNGGGINLFARPGLFALRLENVRVMGNEAEGSGGGIWARGSAQEIVDDPADPPAPLLYLDDQSVVMFNGADEDGGGVHCSNAFPSLNQMMQMRTGNALISNNGAGRNGGGVYLDNCASVIRAGGPFEYIPPSNVIFSGGIVNNTADESGGGLYITGSNYVSISGSGSDEAFGGLADNAAMIVSNQAVRGGGLYVTGEDVLVQAFDAFINGNLALEDAVGNGGHGGAIYISEEARMTVNLWPIEPDTHPDTPCPGFNLQFGTNVVPRCSMLTNNHAQSSGGVAFVWNGAELDIVNSHVMDNSTDGLNGVIHTRNASVFGDEPQAHAIIVNSLLTGNSTGSRLLYAGSGSHLELRWSTVAGNDLDAGNHVARVFSADGQSARLDLDASVIWEPGTTLVSQDGAGSTVAEAYCLIGHEGNPGLSFSSYYSMIDPEFASPDNGNYRPGPTSPVINYCNVLADPPDRDLDFRFRGIGWPGDFTEPPNPAPGGIYDIGAYVKMPDGIFSDAFEAP